jgi:phage terminase small subunit
MKGRPPVPPEQRRLEGDVSHRPAKSAKLVGGRINEDDAVPYPPGFTGDHRAAWDELTGPLIRGGVLDWNDLPLVEACVDALVRLRWARAGMKTASQLTIINPHGRTTNPLVTVSSGASAEFRQLAALLGIGPANRARYSQGAPGAKPDGGLAGEMARVLPPRARLKVVGGDASSD